MPDAVIAEFEQHLAEVRASLAGEPRQEMTHLWLLALEREQIVNVAYRRDVITSRLARMPVDEAVREAVANAIRWTWRDEAMHALWIRGALLERGSLPERARAWLTQLEGHAAGWASSRQHHYRWREAPVTRLVAEVMELSGVAAGRIPPAVRQELGFASFSAFSRFNVAAETTAAMAWARMAELAGDPALDLPDGYHAAFERMQADESRHARLFGLLHRAFDDEDRLADGFTAERLVQEIGAIGQRFLAQPRPGDAAWSNPLGKGGTVTVREGPSLDAVLDAVLVGFEPGHTVAVKTTFMLAVRRDDPSPAVSPALIAALARWLVARGCEVSVIDARNVYDRFHANRSVHEVARYMGIDGPFRLIDAQDDQVPHTYLRGLDLDSVSRAWRDADTRIALGKLRSHPTAQAFLSLEAMEGLGARHDRYVFGDRRADRETALLMAMDAFPPDLALLDAFSDVPDGLLGMMGSPSPLHPRRLYASTDAVALDAVAAPHLGCEPADDRMLVSAAIDWFGDPRGNTTVDGPDTPIAGWRAPDHTRRHALLSRLALPVYTHASQRGALFVPPMDEHAFPPLEAPTRSLRTARQAIWRLIADPPQGQHLLEVQWQHPRGRLLRVARLGQGPPLLLLHGYPDTLQIWARLAPLLATRFEVFAFDWPGQGYSEAWGAAGGPMARADQLNDLLDHWGLERVHLLGADMGGQPALCFAARYPERVGGVVVHNSLLFGDAGTSTEIALMRRSGLNRAAFLWAPRLVYERCRQTFLEPGDAWPDEVEADLIGAFLRPEVRRFVSDLCMAYDASLPALPEAWWKIMRPVLALWSSADGHFDVRQGERLAALLPQARLRVLDDARHWAAWSRPLAVADIVAPFFEEADWTS